MIAKPNLFVVGAMKSGTTTLHNYLGAHPDIFMSPTKEPNYFIHDQNLLKYRDSYLNLFAQAHQATYLGESSTNYTKLPRYQGVAERIFNFNPQAKIIYIMRDPVERSISHYWWEVQWSAEGRDMLRAVKKVKDITDVSYYAMQIRPYLEIFGNEQIFTLTLEELSSTPEKVLKSLFLWLGVDANFLPPNLNQKSNVSPEKVPRVRGASVISQFRNTFVWEILKLTIPASTRQKAIKFLSRPANKNLSSLEQTIQYLRPIQQKQTEELSELLNRKFPEWKTLYSKK